MNQPEIIVLIPRVERYKMTTSVMVALNQLSQLMSFLSRRRMIDMLLIYMQGLYSVCVRGLCLCQSYEHTCVV